MKAVRNPLGAIRSFEAQSVLGALVLKVNGALAGLPGARWDCRRAVPRIDGSLHFDLESGQQRVELNWLGPVEGKPSGDRPALEFSLGSKPIPQGNRLLQAVWAELKDLSGRSDFALLRFYNRDRSSLRFDDQVVDLLLAGRLVPQRTSWFGYRFRDVFQERSDCFRLTFLGPDGGPVGFEIRPDRPPYDEDKLLLKNGLLALTLVEDSRERTLRKKVVHQVERFVGFLLSRAVHSGMVLEAPAEATTSSSQEPISTSRWGNPHQWYQFFADFEVQRSNICSMRFEDPISWVTHGEAECRWVEPDVQPKPLVYYALPWQTVRQPGVAGSGSFPTTLVEADVVLGGTAKLQEALERACTNPGCRLVCVNTTCMPKIIGDDVPSLVSRMSRIHSMPILSLNTDLYSPDSAFQDLIRQARQSIESKTVSKQGTGLNLVGLPATAARQELLGDLQDLGIPLNVCILPEMGLDLFRRYLAGACSVVYPQAFWIKVAKELLSKDGIPWKVLPAPYGLARTIGWYRSIAEIFGQEKRFKNWLKRILPSIQHTWRAWRKRAAKHSLALVIDSASSQRITDATQFYGFEILSLLEEMGFGLHVMVHHASADPSVDLSLVESIATKLASPDRLTVKFFSSPGELGQLLQDGPFDAVYSEVVFDSRVTRAGKARFDLGKIELGLAGALRSVARLVETCEWGFYRRYSPFLAGAVHEQDS
jgi:hypothetical protein